MFFQRSHFFFYPMWRNLIAVFLPFFLNISFLLLWEVTFRNSLKQNLTHDVAHKEKNTIGRISWHFAEVFTGSSWVGFVVCRDTLIQSMHPATYTSKAVVMLLWWALKPTSPQCWKQPSQLKAKVSALTVNKIRSSRDNKFFIVDKPFLLRNQQKRNSFQHRAEDRLNFTNDAKYCP